MVSIVSKARDTVSKLCFDQFGFTNERVVEEAFEANPHLHNYGPLLPAGVTIEFPVHERKVKQGGFRLWDYADDT